MKPLRLLAACLAFLLVPSAHAATFRAYLSINGTDNPNCSLGAPCRLIDAALAAANDGGEVWILDSGNYNLTTVFINKSITILAVPGAIASILGVGADAINVNSTTANVTLRNLVVQQLPGTTQSIGLMVANARSVTVERCSFSGFVVAASVQGGKALFADSSLLNSLYGLNVYDNARASLVRSVVSGNSSYAVSLNATSGSYTTLDVADSTIANNGGDAVSLQANGGYGTATVTRNNILGNGGGGVVASGGAGTLNATLTGNVIAGNSRGVQATGSIVSVYALDNTISTNNNEAILVSGSAHYYSSGTNGVGLNTQGPSGTISSLPKS